MDGPPRRYRFRSDWRVAAPPDAVYRVLERHQDYPLWWPHIREVVQTGPDTGRCRFRSVLPVDLNVTVRALRRDPAARVLEIALGGDLEGRMRFHVAARGAGARVRIRQDTELRQPLLRRLARPARPLLLANHALMMRAGRRGLRAWLGVHLEVG
ncbi:SRPBCC family protein [Streptomyces hoynatensis]|uniref:Polyketide cyclase n=1 Tax=Streptomyces hoynatensis TaxID=1141874 RepID=A0A3A9Z8P5_9ACTN|nr:SRPBCC family protein [Streptomyces hoynatensis]RKN44673.1 polyketide cyclase [Streptomyces hoynatensis]